MRDEKDILRIYERYQQALYRLCYFYTGNGADAADAVQNTLIKLMEYEGVFLSPAHEKGWLMKVGVNECRQILRHWWRKTLSYEDIGEYEVQEQQYQENAVLAEVMRLPVKYRVPIYMHYYEGYSTAEVSQMLNLKESTLRSRLLRGRKMLWLAMGGDEVSGTHEVWKKKGGNT